MASSALIRFFLFASLLFSASFFEIYAEEAEAKEFVVTLDNSNFSDVVSKHNFIVVEFYAPWYVFPLLLLFSFFGCHLHVGCFSSCRLRSLSWSAIWFDFVIYVRSICFCCFVLGIFYFCTLIHFSHLNSSFPFVSLGWFYCMVAKQFSWCDLDISILERMCVCLISLMWCVIEYAVIHGANS